MLDIRLVTAFSKCWINGEISLDYPMIHQRDVNEELSFLKKKDSLNEPIYMIPHEKSKLREFIINKHINKKGLIDESCFGNIYDVVIDGCKFSYRITKCEEMAYTEQELRKFNHAYEELDKRYRMFTNKIYGL